MTKAPFGRPSLVRNKDAGQNLRKALKLWGKTWRRDTSSPDHVRNWKSWTDCDLPSSATTIDLDMREGIPEQRIGAYARCLGISPATLCSPKTDMIQALGKVAEPHARPCPSMPQTSLPHFSERYQEHNNTAYIKDLFELMGGVYRVHYLLQDIELIHRCTLWIQEAGQGALQTRGLFQMFGNENPFEARFFRWHNNLHFQYLCDNGLELGYAMLVDPLRHNLILQRKPLWLRGQGMTDRGLADNQPITFTFRMNQLPRPDSMTHEELWQQECQDVRTRSFLSPGEKDYDAIWTTITTPDELV